MSGGEFNCAANLADCFRLRTGIVTAMVDYPIGELIAKRVRAMGVKPFYKHFKHNGVTGPNMATVYSDRGQGVRWFHSGGIFAALSETTGELIIEGMKAAKAAGVVTSFDLNYREKLWNVWDGQERAIAVVGRIVKNVDVLVGNEEDLQKGLGIKGPEVETKSKLDPNAFFGMIDDVVKKYPWLRWNRYGLLRRAARHVSSVNFTCTA